MPIVAPPIGQKRGVDHGQGQAPSVTWAFPMPTRVRSRREQLELPQQELAATSACPARRSAPSRRDARFRRSTSRCASRPRSGRPSRRSSERRAPGPSRSAGTMRRSGGAASWRCARGGGSPTPSATGSTTSRATASRSPGRRRIKLLRPPAVVRENVLIMGCAPAPRRPRRPPQHRAGPRALRLAAEPQHRRPGRARRRPDARRRAAPDRRRRARGQHGARATAPVVDEDHARSRWGTGRSASSSPGATRSGSFAPRTSRDEESAWSTARRARARVACSSGA